MNAFGTKDLDETVILTPVKDDSIVLETELKKEPTLDSSKKASALNNIINMGYNNQEYALNCYMDFLKKFFDNIRKIDVSPKQYEQILRCVGTPKELDLPSNPEIENKFSSFVAGLRDDYIDLQQTSEIKFGNAFKEMNAEEPAKTR